MKKLSFFLPLLLITILSYGQQTDIRLDSLLKAYELVHSFNGSVLVVKNGVVLLNKGYGYRNANNRIHNDHHTIYQIGSVTKQFTTAVILKLQEKQLLNIQDKLSKYFPDYPKGDSITIEHLMAHTSGIYSYTDDKNFMENEVTIPATREKMMGLFMNKPFSFSPGSGWRYSNSGYSLLGYIIEQVAKKPYEQVVHELILRPLAMNNSGFDFTHLKQAEKATGYLILNDQDTVIAPIVDSTVAYAAGAIYSTTEDLYRWHQGLQKKTIVSKDQQERAYTSVKNNYGYGWGIDSIKGKRRVAHGGGIHGFRSDFSRVPEDDICIIILSNGCSRGPGEITQSIYAVLYDMPYQIPTPKIAASLSREKLQEYEGEYEILPTLKIKLSVKDGQLIGEPTGQPSIIIYAEKEADRFFSKSPEIQLHFNRNEKGSVIGFILHQNGAQINCNKIK